MLGWLQQNQAIANVVFSGVVALSTIVYALLTWRLVAETRRMRSAQTDPRVVTFVEPREEFFNFGHLYVRNIGLGPAFKVKFKLTARTDGPGAQFLIADFTKSRFLETGVAYLGPGQQLESHYTAFHENHEEKLGAIIEVGLEYQNAAGQRFQETSLIDMSEFRGRGRLGTPSAYSMAQSLEKIEKHLSSLATGFLRLRVDTYDTEDRAREREDWEEARRKAAEDEPAP